MDSYLLIEGDGLLGCGGARPKFRRQGTRSGVAGASGSQLHF